jgi:hypothetical protein
LPRGFTPDDQSDPQWYAFITMRVRCRATEQLGKATPARTDHLGKFTLDDARLGELPAILHPHAGARVAVARLQKASGDGVSWKKWDGSVRVVPGHGERVGVVGKNVDCFLQVLGRGDLDGDGIEDLVLLRSGGGRRGTWRSITAFVVTRRGPGQRSPWLDGRQEQLELREIRSSRREGVSPLQCWESRKARVRRTELTTVCYSQGRQMGIGDEIPGCLPLDKHLP